jgi:S1-C subfamily serine protease
MERFMERKTTSFQIIRPKSRSLCLIALSGILWTLAESSSSADQPGRELAIRLTQNIVQIRAKLAGGSRDGFGFVFGERDGLIYIATANHVVRGGREEIDRTPTVVFSRFQGTPYSGKLLETSSRLADLAVIAIETENLPGLGWTKEVLAATTSVLSGSDVWFVGLDRKWFVPVVPGRVSTVNDVNRIEYSGNVISAGGLSINVGTSGAPLISNDGIVGMIVSDSNRQEVEAIPIERIESFIRDWEQPWQLTVIQPKQDCDRLAASPDDPRRPPNLAGVSFDRLDIKKALSACFFPILSYGNKIPRFAFQAGRAYEANEELGLAERYYSLAAERGYPAAQSALGFLYESQSKDVAASELYRRAADQGDPVGQTNLATMLRDDYGGTGKNDEMAVRLYKDAAGKNYPPALSGLAWMYEQGRVDGQPNEAEARLLYERAVAAGDRYATRALQRLNFQ